MRSISRSGSGITLKSVQIIAVGQVASLKGAHILPINIVASCYYNAFSNPTRFPVTWHFFRPFDHQLLDDRSNYIIWLRCISLTRNHYKQLAFCQWLGSNCVLQETKPSSQFSPFGNSPLRSPPCLCLWWVPRSLNHMALSLILGKYHHQLGFWLEFQSKL